MLLIFAESKSCAKPPASKSKTLSRIWPIGRGKIGMRCFANSTVIFQRKKMPREALLRESPSRRSIRHRLRSRWLVPRSCGSRAVSLACAETVLPNQFGFARAKACRRVLNHRPLLLHRHSHVEADLFLVA